MNDTYRRAMAEAVHAEAAPSPSEGAGTGTPTHELRVWPRYFDALLSGVKSFEFRKDDREPRFAVGDVLQLREWRPPFINHGVYSGRECFRRVTYVARGGVVPEGFCVMSIEPVSRPAPSAPPTAPDANERVVRHANGHLMIERVPAWVPNRDEINAKLTVIAKAWPVLAQHANHLDGGFDKALTDLRRMVDRLLEIAQQPCRLCDSTEHPTEDHHYDPPSPSAPVEAPESDKPYECALCGADRVDGRTIKHGEGGEWKCIDVYGCRDRLAASLRESRRSQR